MHARQRESALTGAIYRHHPRFAGTPLLYGGSREEAWFEGGDVLVMAPGVVAVGVGQRTTPAGVEAFALRAFAAGSRTPCSRSRSRRSARPCTSTPSARWSTATRS